MSTSEGRLAYDEYVALKSKNEKIVSVLAESAESIENEIKELKEELPDSNSDDVETISNAIETLETRLKGIRTDINKYKNSKIMASRKKIAREKILAELPNIFENETEGPELEFYRSAMSTLNITSLEVKTLIQEQSKSKKVEELVESEIQQAAKVPFKEIENAPYAINKEKKQIPLNGKMVYSIRVEREKENNIGVEDVCSRENFSKGQKGMNRNIFGSNLGNKKA